VTALPTNLALVGEDLARATLIDARRSLRRRRLVTYSVALVLLALTGTVAVANGWLFGETPTLRAIPSLGSGPTPGVFAPGSGITGAHDVTQSEAQHRAAQLGTGGSAPLGSANGPASRRTLLTNLGPQRRVLSSVTTTSGGVCLALTGFAVQCVPTFAPGQQLAWFVWSPPTGATLIWGIVRDEVTSVEAISADGRTTLAKLANDAFYVELIDGPPARLVARSRDGKSTTETFSACPPTTPFCTP
jgi:hypothetical protein